MISYGGIQVSYFPIFISVSLSFFLHLNHVSFSYVPLYFCLYYTIAIVGEISHVTFLARSLVLLSYYKVQKFNIHSTMANLLRSAESACYWTQNELAAYNIIVTEISAPAFFNVFPLPQPGVSPIILNNLNMPVGNLPRHIRLFFQHLDLARNLNSIESRVDDFGAHLLHLLHYDDRDRVVCQRMDMTLPMAGMIVQANPNVCILHANQLDILLVVENKVRTPVCSIVQSPYP